VTTHRLSIVVVAHDMGRELPRTLRSLAADYQRDIAPDDYEIVVVDNGSPTPVSLEPVEPRRAADVRLLRVDPAPASPARAANLGIRATDGDIVGLIIDGARMASPGLLALARRATRMGPRTIVATLAWHLGASRHMDADRTGYDQVAEDALLAKAGWFDDGYRLFDISTLAASSSRGWFGPIGESSALFMPRVLWNELDGLDERFELPGGGLVNHDLFHRACDLDDVDLITLLGEGTFHQIHGGAATSRRFGWDEMDADYQALRGAPYRPPDKDSLLVGPMGPSALPHLALSLDWANQRLQKQRSLRG
jgi:hypothetical protein